MAIPTRLTNRHQRYRPTTHDFIAKHRNQGHVVDASAASIPACFTCKRVYVMGRVLAFEPEPELKVR